MENNKYTEPNLRFATVGGGKNAQPLANEKDSSIDNVEKSVPSLRFSEFEGEWEKKKLGVLALEFKYGINAASKTYDGENKYLRITDIEDSSHVFLLSDITSPDVNLSLCDDYILQDGDIAVARTGASVGKSYIYHKNDGKVYFAGFLIRIRIRGNFDKDFIYNKTLTDSYLRYIVLVSQRSGQPGVNVEELKDFCFRVPINKVEQQKIASYFTSLDQQVKAATKRVASLKQVKAACLQSMFPQEGETVPKVRFQGFEGEWKERKLGDVSDIYQPQTIGSERFTEKGYDVYGANGIIGKYPKYNHLTNQSMIACRGSNCGVVNHSIGKCWINGNAMVVNVDNYNVEKTFILFVLQRQDFTSIITGSGQPQIVREPLLQWNIIIPDSIAEQQKIATFFTSLDKQIDLESQRLEKLKQVKKACLDKMFV